MSAVEASRRPTPQGRRRDAHARQRRDTTTVTEDVSSTIGYMISDSPSDESNMLLQIADSPMSITVDATLWQTYESGIITASSGCGTSIDHAVQLVGYNAPQNYWIVRNSWGETWVREREARTLHRRRGPRLAARRLDLCARLGRARRATSSSSTATTSAASPRRRPSPCRPRSLPRSSSRPKRVGEA